MNINLSFDKPTISRGIVSLFLENMTVDTDKYISLYLELSTSDRNTRNYQLLAVVLLSD